MPLCGVKIAAGASEEGASEWLVGRCDHPLFAGIDEVGFEYRSKRFDDALEAAIGQKTEEERDEPLEDDIPEMAALVEIPNSFMFQSMMGHPAEQTSYVGFAPVE